MEGIKKRNGGEEWKELKRGMEGIKERNGREELQRGIIERNGNN